VTVEVVVVVVVILTMGPADVAVAVEEAGGVTVATVLVTMSMIVEVTGMVIAGGPHITTSMALQGQGPIVTTTGMEALHLWPGMVDRRPHQ
jgi:hypothetical protein